MPISIRRKLCVGAAMAGWIFSSHAQDIGSRWQLRVMDPTHTLKVEGIIRFAKEVETKSCMRGYWKRVLVESRRLSDEAFFPLAEPLAYEVRQGELTFGRTQVCDGYLFLSGRSQGKKISGTFYSLGLGYNQSLGYFSLTKLP